MKYYNLNRIKNCNATYNIIMGERSNGKTYAALKHCLVEYIKTGGQMAYVRRWKEDTRGRRASALFSALLNNDEVSKLTNGEFTGIHYYAGKWYLCTYNENKKPIYSDTDIIAFAFALSDIEHDKSTSFPNITNIVFDEFVTSQVYLQDEFVIFMNVVSTIVRKRENVKIYMLGNTVNRYCPYFREMGLEHARDMKQGTIDIYTYGNSELKVAVEFCKPTKASAASNKYFAFDNPKLEMITSGVWELGIYPHIPMKYKNQDIIFTYFIIVDDTTFQCEVIEKEENYFTFIHEKTTPIKYDDDMVFCLEHTPNPHWCRNIMRPFTKLQKRLQWFFVHDKVFYQDNKTGDTINNYLKLCKQGV